MDSPLPRSASEDPELVEGPPPTKKYSPLFTILIGLLVLTILGLSGYLAYDKLITPAIVSNYEECVANNGIIQESYPQVCVTKSGQRFVQPLLPQSTDPVSSWKTYTNNEYGFSIRYPEQWTINSPSEDKVIIDDSKPVAKEVEINIYKNVGNISAQEYISNIFFSYVEENQKKTATAGIEYLDTVIGLQPATEIRHISTECCGYDKIIWLTRNGTGIAILEEVQAGTLDYFELIVSTLRFTETNEKTNSKNKTCIVGGCSGQLCVDANSDQGISTCEWKEEYACYKNATCKVQSDGNCGWTQTPELTTCLNKYK